MKKIILSLIVLSMAGVAHASASKTEAKVDCNQEATYPEISKADLQKAVDSKSAFVVDVNSASSFKEHHVPTAIHFGSTQNFAKALPADKNAMIVAYCGGPKCTAWKKAAVEACKLGYTHIRHFTDGISGWIKN